TGAVHVEDGGEGAHREAVGLLQGEPAVGRRPPTADPEPLLEGSAVSPRAGQTAAHTGADPDQVASWLGLTERRVVVHCLRSGAGPSPPRCESARYAASVGARRD